MHTFIENYLHFIKNSIRPPYKKLKSLKSGFIENLNFENNRDPCPIFKNWNERLSFPGIASNGNSRSSVTFLWLNCKHGSKKCISAVQPSSNVPIALQNGDVCPRRDTALGHHAKRKRPRRAFVDSSLQKNEFAKHLNLDLPNFLLPLKSVQTNLRQNWNAAYSDFKGRLRVPRSAPAIGRSMPRLSSRQIGESDASSCWCWSCCRPNATGNQSQKKHVGRVSRNMCLRSSFANRVVMVLVLKIWFGPPNADFWYVWSSQKARKFRQIQPTTKVRILCFDCPLRIKINDSCFSLCFQWNI